MCVPLPTLLQPPKRRAPTLQNKDKNRNSTNKDKNRNRCSHRRTSFYFILSCDHLVPQPRTELAPAATLTLHLIPRPTMLGLKSTRCVLPRHIVVSFPWDAGTDSGARFRGGDDDEEAVVCPATVIINGPKIIAVLLSATNEDIMERYPDITIEDHGDAVIMVRSCARWVETQGEKFAINTALTHINNHLRSPALSTLKQACAIQDFDSPRTKIFLPTPATIVVPVPPTMKQLLTAAVRMLSINAGKVSSTAQGRQVSTCCEDPTVS